MQFETEASAKWIFAGEHSVLRGFPALALPLKQYRTHLKFKTDSNNLKVFPHISLKTVNDLTKLTNEFFHLRNKSFQLNFGKMILDTNIPFSSGLGSSAALCVAFSRFVFEYLKLPIDIHFLIELAKFLENKFHGESSGLDVTVITLQKPVVFQKEKELRILDLDYLPDFKFFDTGFRASTKLCVEQVKRFQITDAVLAQKLDQQMSQAVDLGVEALILWDQAEKMKLNKDLKLDHEQNLEASEAQKLAAETLIIKSMKLSSDVFKAWGLIPSLIQQHQDSLSLRALRLTGAGKGGYLVGLR